jgi:S-adenosylmethionine hydrolase
LETTPLITLLTDFGYQDPYVGVMKGVIARICPAGRVIDLSHGVRPQAVSEAAYLLLAGYRYFPRGTVHVAVVDPGVGSARRIIAVRTEEYVFLAPDNGLLGYVLCRRPPEEVVSVSRDRYFLRPVSRTFHGRDVFAPVAAHLARGVPLSELGESIDDFQEAPIPKPRELPIGLQGTVLYVDHFGNVVTNFPSSLEEEITSVVAGGQEIAGVSASYSEVPDGALLALFGSGGFLEISLRGGSAADVLGLKIGASVVAKIR